MQDKDVIALLAGGAVLLQEEDGGYGAQLVTRHTTLNAEQWNRLAQQGWLNPFSNCGGAWLSDAGRLAYIRSTDEMGNGELVPPNVLSYNFAKSEP